ncbi:MAG: hypothetical protein NZ578_01515 [Candidatus Binatia bacterium]|nr:hypothetical protein [Candidatus Binatia bacterium]
MSHGSLPPSFRSLERFNAWALAKEGDRIRKRRASTMEELRELYDALMPQMEAIVAYLDQFSPAHLPEDAQRLLWLALSFVEVTSAVELYGQPEVRNGLDDPTRFRPVE